MSNPLLERHSLPPFSRILPEHAEPAIDELLARNRARIAELTGAASVNGWDLVAELEQLNDDLAQAWSPVSHLNGVMNSDAWREAYNACLPKLSEYWTELGQHQGLYKAFEALANSDEYAQLSPARRKVIDNALRDFRLSGIALPEAQQKRYAELQQRLSELTTRFSENLLDATQGWWKEIHDEQDLAGLPDHAVAAAKEAASAKGVDGWVITLDFPAYYAVMAFADSRSLREELYRAFSTRASDQGPKAGEWDNSAVMDEILTLRHEMAQLLGFDTYADYSLATKMAQSPQQVVSFLEDLAQETRPVAEQELAELKAFAREQDGIEQLQAWDVTYYGEKLKQARFDISQQELRPYFPLPKVLDGMFTIAGRLFDLQVEELQDFDSWHDDVRLFALKREGEAFAYCYLDPFARSSKRGGAWMDDCRVRRRLGHAELQLPVAYLVCNFTPPLPGQSALLTHDEVTTLFHEFGHGLHHMLTQMEEADISGINGVAWDAVELPSQFMENWCWEPEALALISGHHETGEPLPQSLLDKMLAAKHFQSGMMMMRQLEFSLFDFRLHHEYQPGQTQIQSVLDSVREQVAVIRPPAENRFQHGFGHIFAGGYAAGYYSYKWAEVLSADAFSRFEEEGIFNAETGQSFRQEILERGGSGDPMDLFVAFRGREPDVDALLRHSGIRQENAA
ncbi:oligopeptidase A [Marinobacterium sp. AK62]|uniref:oligopeptidase A n=1 Tax=Marinobacterium alkalitolerans TaxID=1542925 RepID=A0ABS3ZE26_9GAMM|nr:oligopeptidase A [Marinobacterium alkalitolerans]MBP0049956.1 oligopeptidase A [Marinobacterium alkalitolerans]